MKVLFFASDYAIGFSAMMVDELIEFHKHGIDICAVGSNKEQEPGLIDSILKEGIDLTIIPDLDVHANYSQFVKRISRLIVEKDIDVVHIQNNWQMAILGAVKMKLRRTHPIKVVYTIHAFRNNSKWKALIARLIIGTGLKIVADKVICMTQYLKHNFRFIAHKIELIPLGVTTSFFTDELVAPACNDGLRMIFPAQFRHGKHQETIIKAFAGHVKRIGDETSILLLPGSGKLKEKMEQLAKNEGLQDRVEFPGLISKEDVRQAMLNCNVGIVASESETFGQCIVEPYVLGRCVVSTPVGIAPEIIEDGINGFIYNTEEELSNIMTRLYQNPELIKEISTNNFNQRSRFLWSSIADQYAKKVLGSF